MKGITRSINCPFCTVWIRTGYVISLIICFTRRVNWQQLWSRPQLKCYKTSLRFAFLVFTCCFDNNIFSLMQLSTDQSESLLGNKSGASINTANISWHGISASTKQGKKCFKVVPSKPILKSVSGKVDSGQLLAVMGPR